MSDSSNSKSGGISVVGVLTIVFVVLKLTHTITWGWVWVLSPLWISFGVSLVCFVLFFIIAGLIAMVQR